MAVTQELIRKPQSVKVDKELKKNLKRFYSKFTNKSEAARTIQIDFRVIDKVLKDGTCSPDTKTKIENFFNN